MGSYFFGKSQRNKKSCAHKTSGVTLIEVMISLSIATALIMSMLEYSSNARRVMRNASTTTDWMGFLSTVRLTLSNDQSCNKILGFLADNGITNYDYNGTLGTGSTLPFNSGTAPSRLAMKSPILGQPDIPIVDTAPGSYPHFTIDSFQLQLTPGQISSQVVLPDPDDGGNLKIFLKHSLRLTMQATKRAEPGTLALGRRNLEIPIPIDFQIVTGPAFEMDGTPTGRDHEIETCFGSQNSLQALCIALGGYYTQTPQADQTQCIIENISFFGGSMNNTAFGPVTDPAMAGERVQLQGLFGLLGAPVTSPLQRSRADYAIGVNREEIWFNMGGDGNSIFSAAAGTPINQYTWHWTENDATAQRYLMSLDADANLILNPANNQFNAASVPRNPVLGFGLSAGIPTEYISSERSTANTRFGDLEFSVNNAIALMMLRNGEFRFMSPNNRILLEFGGNIGGTFPRAWIESNISGDGRDFKFVTNTGTAAIPNNFSVLTLDPTYVQSNRHLLAYGSVIALNNYNTAGPTLLGQPTALYVNGPSLFRNEVDFQGTVTVNETGGNVLINCQTREIDPAALTQRALDAFRTTNCAANEVVISGSLACIGGSVQLSMPIDPATDGILGASNGWIYACSNGGGGITRASITCCQH